MEKMLQKISRKIIEQREQLAKFITEKQNARYPDQFSDLAGDLLQLRIELVTLYGESLVMEDEERKRRLVEWGKETGRKCALMGTTLDAMLNEIPHYRHFIGEMIKQEAISSGLSAEELYSVITELDETMIEVTYYFSIPFVEFHEEQIRKSQMAVVELSAPVVPITKGVAVLPLIGAVDTFRAKAIMEQALTESVRLKLSHFVLDLSGVPIIDTYVAQELFQIIEALKLIGVDASLSGITPDIAQTVVSLGINFGSIQTFASLQNALESIGLVHDTRN